MCCDAPDPPDMTPFAQQGAEAAQMARQTAAEDLAFRKQVYQDSLPRQQELLGLAKQVVSQQMGIADAAEQRAAAQWLQHQQEFLPIERQMALDAFGSQYFNDDETNALIGELRSGNMVAANRYAQLGSQRAADKYQGMMDEADTRARGLASTEGQLARTAAIADVNSVYAQQARGLMRMGGDPTRMAAAAAQIANQQALQRVNAANTAYRSTYDREREVARLDASNRFGMTDRGVGLRAGAASFGRNMPNTAAQNYGLATAAGSSALANQNAGYMAPLPYAQFQSGGAGSAFNAASLSQQGALSNAQMLMSPYGAQLANAGANAQGLGTAAGLAAAAWISDRRLKSDIELVGVHPLGIGIYEYTIDGRRERGVMADEVEQVLPEAVINTPTGYKMVNYEMLR